MERPAPSLASTAASRADSQPLDYSSAESVKGSDAAASQRRTSRLSVAARRARFVLRFIYWSIRHGSTKHAAWVANFEGYYW